MVDYGNDVDLDPLLDLSAPLTPIQQETSMLSESLLFQEEDPSTNAKEAQHQLIILRILGRPYAADYIFWTRALPLSLFQGALLGGFTTGFLGLVHFLLGQWLSAEAPDCKSHGKWGWLIITTAGGLLSAALLQVPGVPKLGLIRTVFHDIRDLKGNPLEAYFVIAASVVALASGAPLGPEVAIGALGSGLAAFLARYLKLDRRTEAGLVQSGLAGSLGGLFLSPIFGVTLVHELSVAGRPVDLLLDTLTATETNVSRDSLAHLDHDCMEQVTLGGAAATAAYVVLRVLVPLTLPSSQWFQVMDLGEDDSFELWHLAAAIPIGLMCGKFGMLALALIGAFRSLRIAACETLHARHSIPKWVGLMLFPTIAGIVHGLLSIWNPFLVGSGMGVLQELLRQEVTFSTVPWFMVSASCKVLSMSLCLGFGLVGGPIFPMIFVGSCVGMATTPLLPASMAVPCCISATVGSFLPVPFTLVFSVSFAMSLSVNQIGPVFVATFVAFSLVGGSGSVKRYGEKRLGYSALEVNLAQWSQLQGAEDELFLYESLEEEEEKDDAELTREVRNAVFGSASTGCARSK